MTHLIHITVLYDIYKSENQAFRKVHRMIDLFESIIKTHTAVILGEYVKHNKLSDAAKGMLAQGFTGSSGLAKSRLITHSNTRLATTIMFLPLSSQP